jgi:glycosyltransferase involved in cell wall biosynthesis
MIDFLYLLAEYGLTIESSPVLEAQVFDRMMWQQKNGISTALVAVVGDQVNFQERFTPSFKDARIPYESIPRSGMLTRLIRCAKATRQLVKSNGTRYVYVREPWSALTHQLAFPVRGPELIYDMRGDVAAEARFRGTPGYRRWALERLTSRAIRHADSYAAVSADAAGAMMNNYGASAVSVIPSCVDISKFERGSEQRDSIRRDLGVSQSDVLLIYSGGSQEYQMLPQMFHLWESLAMDTSVHFLTLMHGSDSDYLVGRLPEDRTTRMSVERDQVPGYLSAADIGFLLRAAHPLNTVASPLKFGEYLASGLSVVSSPGVGDISRIIEQRDLGVLINADQAEISADAVRELIDDVRNHRVARSEVAREVAGDTYHWGAYVDEWKEMLRD